MTYDPNCTLPKGLPEQIAQHGMDVLPGTIRTVINTGRAYFGVVGDQR